MRFKVSTNIKNILGKDMISDKYIAIFELVKNSCDAGAKNVSIEFKATNNRVSRIIISDDGCGMTSKDLQDKWLFMAYSEKRHTKNKNRYAGSKGIGRFSCDRLGAQLILKTKKETENSGSQLVIDWSEFENNDTQKVEEVELEYTTIESDCFSQGKGTILDIYNLREDWSRNDILRLRSALMKLVSPDIADDVDHTIITIVADHEKAEDSQEQLKNKYGASKSGYGNLLVNGPIVNDIFEKLGLKTTSVSVEVSEDGDIIKTTIEDRGNFIFNIVRKNETYDNLENIRIKLYYLNRAAKVNFTRLMGVESVNYGSIFVYKNGFRVYPYGEVGLDVFGINERKSQGYNRYLGTRELIGRIQINGDNDKFVEKSSRDGGFIENPATMQLTDFFIAEVVRVLEKYVVDGIDWGDPDRALFVEGKNEQGLMPLDVADKILLQFANLTKRGEVLSADINPSIVQYAQPKEDTLQKSIKGLEKIAGVSNSPDMQALVDDIKKEAEILRKDKDAAQKDVDKISETLRQRDIELKTREKQAESFKRKLNINASQYEDALHIIYVVSEAAKVNLEKICKLVDSNNLKLIQLATSTLGDIKRVFKLADLSINYDYGISIKKPRDLVSVIKNYVRDVWSNKINVSVETEKKDWKILCNFDVSKITLIVDNIISNSRKAKAKNIKIFVKKDNDTIRIIFSDDGIGLSGSIKNPESIFERGYSTTFGLGLGLYHTKEILESMGGDIHLDKNVKLGFTLEVTFKYECRF